METLKLLKQLYKEGRLTKQELKTYRGQILSGNKEAALIGMQRKKLI